MNTLIKTYLYDGIVNNNSEKVNKTTLLFSTLFNLDYLDINISKRNIIDIINNNQSFNIQLLEERMKLYEKNYPNNIPESQYFIVRLDGNNFKKYT